MSNAKYGGFWIRLVAALLDGVIFGVPLAIISVLSTLAGVATLYYVVYLGVIILTIYLDGTKGGTPGKLILGLKIVNEKGDVIGIPSAILRYIGKIVSGLILCIGYIMIAFTDKKRGLHDMIANTYVIKTK